jgi:hypothetical protein
MNEHVKSAYESIISRAYHQLDVWEEVVPNSEDEGVQELYNDLNHNVWDAREMLGQALQDLEDM